MTVELENFYYKDLVRENYQAAELNRHKDSANNWVSIQSEPPSEAVRLRLDFTLSLENALSCPFLKISVCCQHIIAFIIVRTVHEN